MVSEISERISTVVASVGLTKSAFAQRLNLSQPFVSRLCSGVSVPSDRTILDICREFRVQEPWLRTGEGEMFAPQDQDAEIAEFMADVLSDVEPSFRRRFVAALSRLSPDDWALVERFARSLAADPDEKGD